ncbi:AzlD domain-containing protein [Nonomuraea sp. KC401]|uniref:AzlD domain-containing protein n=1 Tax=unclassified Nonomuraea TaxID=2593643 RepID=UPI0010FD623A|nr:MULTISPECIES: AzlD domain-containing protein [unclassified Nonomuraea]NBE99425.1 AzlD domain-containing protein [Nonomuraea sp. K271]TLF57391.1 AzlD domain-containing protein [Nonomuraea sp. KC401]
MSMLLLIIGMGLCSFLPRYLPLAVLAGREMPAVVEMLLKYTPPAVLAALVFPAVLTPSGKGIELTLANPYLIGGAITFAAGVISKRFLLSTSIGIAAFYVSRWLIG